MIITIHLVDGRKITKDQSRIIFFGGNQNRRFPDVAEGQIAINIDNIVDMRPAEYDEIEHAKIHGW